MTKKSCVWSTGAYCWWNSVNNKVYVGGAYKSLTRRKETHLKKLRASRHPNPHLQASWNKYGEKSFKFLVLERCAPENVQGVEQKWINDLYATDRGHGYNICPTAGNMLGFRHSAESRDLMSRTRSGKPGKPHTVETRTKMSEQRRGRKLSATWVQNMAAARMGKPKSEDHKAKIGAKHWSKGPNAAEIRLRIQAANAARVWTNESKRKASDSKRK